MRPRHPLIATMGLTVCLASAPTGLAQESASYGSEENAEKTTDMDERLKKLEEKLEEQDCPTPDFYFEWRGSSQLYLTADLGSEMSGRLKVKVRPHPVSLRPQIIKSHRIGVENGNYMVAEHTKDKREPLFRRLGPDDEIIVSGFSNEKNNGRKTIVWATRTEIAVTADLVKESAGKAVVFAQQLPEVTGKKPFRKTRYPSIALDFRPLPLGAANGQMEVDWTLTPEDVAPCSEVASVVAWRRHLFSLDAGQVYTYEKDGSFDGKGELALGLTSRWNRWISGFFDLRFSAIGEIDEEPETAEMNQPDAEGDTGMPMDTGASDPFNPFVKGGSVVSFNTWLGINPGWRKRRVQQPLLFVAGAGFTTRPGEADQFELQPRLFAGVRIQVVRFDVDNAAADIGGPAFLQFGLAHDELWEFEELGDTDNDPETPAIVVNRVDEKYRWFADAEVRVPGLSTNNIHFKLRLHADLPRSGNGPSDFRISALADINVSQIFKRNGG